MHAQESPSTCTLTVYCSFDPSQIPNFITSIRANESALRIYRKMMCLLLLPPSAIDNAYQELKQEANNLDSALEYLKDF